MPLEVVAGARVSVEGDFRIGGVLADPLAVTAVVRAPSGDTESYSYPTDIVREAIGVYRLEFNTTEAGPYAVRFEGSGLVEAVSETFINVNPSAVI